MAEVMEQAERYQDMINTMKPLFEQGQLSLHERNLMSVAYKNVVGERRAAYRVLSSIQHKEEKNNNAPHVTQIKLALGKVEKELADICHEVISTIESRLLPKASDAEEKVFFLKMVGDYYRYIAENTTNAAEANKAKDGCTSAYEAATKEASAFHGCNPTRLSLALNHSVFLYEIKNDPASACVMAKNAFDAGIAELDQLNEDDYKDATMVLQLLKDNLTLWTSVDAE